MSCPVRFGSSISWQSWWVRLLFCPVCFGSSILGSPWWVRLLLGGGQPASRGELCPLSCHAAESSLSITSTTLGRSPAAQLSALQLSSYHRCPWWRRGVVLPKPYRFGYRSVIVLGCVLLTLFCMLNGQCEQDQKMQLGCWTASPLDSLGGWPWQLGSAAHFAWQLGRQVALQVVLLDFLAVR